MELELSDLWTAGGVLLGFQVTAFSWRVGQEVSVADRDDISWIPPADYVNLAAMVIASLGIFVLPGLGYLTVATAAKLLGLATVAFVGHSFAIAGHYELFNHRSKRTYEYFPTQEKIAIGVVAVALVAYLMLAFA